MMIKLILLLLISVNLEASEISCDKHPIYCQIMNNKRKIEHKQKVKLKYLTSKYAMKISNIIYKTSVENGIESDIFTAILMQESKYQLKLNNCTRGLTVPDYKKVRVCTDFGISQIYFMTAKRYGFDIKRLNEDIEYSINAGGTVLGDFKRRYYKKETDNYWTRYNASTPSKRKIYYNKVMEWY